MLRTLAAFGFEWDGPICYQSARFDLYAEALEQLRDCELLFDCACSRRELQDEQRYPGTCRERPPPPGIATATRLRVEGRHIRFEDRVQGGFRQDVATAVGDLLLKRRDGIYAYLLAVVVDDAAQGITHVVRGADLLDNTPRQIYLQQALGLPLPQYAHVPLITESDGRKLAKSRHDVAVGGGSTLGQLCAVFAMLGMRPPADLSRSSVRDAWMWAIERWRIERVPKGLVLPYSERPQSPGGPQAT
jgi:glutamyl-Q tRNA(Asp) synthetase